jgi:ComF family protein
MGIFDFFGRANIAQDCHLCGMTSLRAICTGCEDDLARVSVNCCRICALPLPAASLCGRCLADPPAFDATCAALRYEFPATRLVQAFKYNGKVGLAATLAGLLENAIDASSAGRPGLLVAMPLARARLAERGYNQAREIARVLARRLNLPLDRDGVTRIRQGAPQAELPLPERRRNVRGAFATTRNFSGLDVAVVDDVMTTGATLDELAGVLKAAGAARVRNWVLARTPL